MAAVARITLRRSYSQSLALVKDRPTEMLKLEKVCNFLAYLQNLVDLMGEWEAEAVFSEGMSSDCPTLEKDIGLVMLKMFGRACALERWMWKPINGPESGVRAVGELSEPGEEE